MELPHREGVRAAQSLEPVDGPAYHATRVSQAVGLADLTAEYVFFTHGLFFTHGHMERDPVFAYICEHNLAQQIFHIDLPLTIFQGLASTSQSSIDWGSRLLMCPRARWNPLRLFLSRTSYIDYAHQYFFRTFVRELDVVDVLALSRMATLPTVCPTIEVTVFGVDSTAGCIGFMAVEKPNPINPPHLIALDPRQETIRLAQRLLGRDPKPFAAVEPTWEQAWAAAIKKHTSGEQNNEGEVPSPPGIPGGL